MPRTAASIRPARHDRRRRRRDRRPRDPRRRRAADRRDGCPAASGRRVPAQGARGRGRHQRVRQERRPDAIERTGRAGDTDRADHDAVGRHDRHGAGPRRHRRSSRSRAHDDDGESAGLRMQRRLPQRRAGAGRHRGALHAGARRRQRRRRARRGRCRARHVVLRPEGWRRHGIAHCRPRRVRLHAGRAGAREFRADSRR